MKHSHLALEGTALTSVHLISSCACTSSMHKCVTGIQWTRFMFWLVCSSFDCWKGVGQAEEAAALLPSVVRKPWHCMLWNQTLTPGSSTRTSDLSPRHADRTHGTGVQGRAELWGPRRLVTDCCWYSSPWGICCFWHGAVCCWQKETAIFELKDNTKLLKNIRYK